jgi:S1-C subfamily serine protease
MPRSAAPMARCAWAAAAALLGLTAGCGGSSDAVRPTVPAAATASAGRLDLGVVAITARIGGDRVESAGAVADADRGLIVTTAHGVWGARSVKVSTGIAVLHGRIVARDACDNLAVLETQPRLPGLVAIEPAPDGALLAGRPIVAVRRRAALPSPNRPDLTTDRVTVTTKETGALVRGVRPRRAVLLNAPSLPSYATGAPLIGDDGRLAGIAQILRAGRGWVRSALPWETIDARMQELEPGGRAQYVGWREHYRCQGALDRYAAARHPGYRPVDARLNAPVPATRLPGTEGVDR